MADTPPALRMLRSKEKEPQIDRLIVPLDGTTESEVAVTPALKIARKLAVPLELFTVQDTVRGRWAAEIDAVAAETEYENVEVVCVSTGSPGEHLVSMAAENPRAVICLATHARDRFSRMVTGSVTEHVVRESPSPVLIVGPNFEPAAESGHYSECMVCLDGSERDQAAVSTAKGWAQQLDLNVHLVHIDSPRHRDEHRVYEDTLSAAASELVQSGIHADYSHFPSRDAAEGIVTLQSKRPGTLTVMNRRPRSVARWVLGSVTAKVLSEGTAPILLAKMPPARR